MNVWRRVAAWLDWRETRERDFVLWLFALPLCVVLCVLAGLDLYAWLGGSGGMSGLLAITGGLACVLALFVAVIPRATVELGRVLRHVWFACCSST